MTNCPNCHKPLMSDGHFSSFAQFKMKCPACQSLLLVTVQPKIVTQLLEDRTLPRPLFAASPFPQHRQLRDD